MDKQSDLILDSKLNTRFESEFTVHIYRQVSTGSERRLVVQREEYWRRQTSPIGSGAYGSVWLEKCEHGQQEVEVRAVKEVSTRPLRSGRQVDYSRELEAIAKFSHHKVSLKFHYIAFRMQLLRLEVRPLLHQVIWMVSRRRNALHRNGVSSTR